MESNIKQIVVILKNFEGYLQGEKLLPKGPIEFKEVQIRNIEEYVNSLVNDRFLRYHGVKEGANLVLTPDELSLKVNSAYLKTIEGDISLFIDVGHARKEEGIYILDKIFQGRECPYTDNQMVIGFSMASLMYHYAIKLRDKFLLENN